MTLGSLGALTNSKVSHKIRPLLTLTSQVALPGVFGQRNAEMLKALTEISK